MESKEEIKKDKEPIISIRGLYKSFDELDILEDVNIDIYRGENLVVMGLSGAGKSVLIKIIIGLIPPDKGTIKVLGRDITKLKGKELDAVRLHIGFSFQGSALYDSMSVRENLEFPLRMNRKKLTKQEIDAEVAEVLEAVGLKDKIDVMPADLSGGQRKRIGIARTLILKPEIMLYDEPTAGLDPITSDEINQLINSVQQKYNTSSIIITHDLTCAKTTGNKIGMLLDGTFKKVGTFDEVFNPKGDKEVEEEIKHFYNYNFIE
ncbi:MAG: rsaD [Crocinitomicaceae bacterium]|jgi:phospholipid/cholesterol/gamma-HCH transport system ATP-binding protein|nr:rsaD [Crocinitomicaceae bacterium]